MNWKERFDLQFSSWELPEENILYPKEVKDFISTEIIEKLIEGIPDNANVRDSYDGDIDLSGKDLKQQLKDKWL